MDLGLWFLCVDLWVSSDSHLVHFKRSVIFPESDPPLCLDDIMFTLPYSLATIIYSLQLALRPEAAPSNAAGGYDFLPEPLLSSSNSHFFSVQTSETIPRSWFQIGVLTGTSSVSKQVRQSPGTASRLWISHVLPWLILGRLITTVIDVAPTITFSNTPRGTLVIVGCLQRCFGWFPFTLWSAVPTADIGLCGFSMGSLARSIIRYTIEGVIWLFVQAINNEPDDWVPD